MCLQIDFEKLGWRHRLLTEVQAGAWLQCLKYMMPKWFGLGWFGAIAPIPKFSWYLWYPLSPHTTFRHLKNGFSRIIGWWQYVIIPFGTDWIYFSKTILRKWFNGKCIFFSSQRVMNITEPWRDEKKDRPDLDIPCPILAPLQSLLWIIAEVWYEEVWCESKSHFAKRSSLFVFFLAYLAYSA